MRLKELLNILDDNMAIWINNGWCTFYDNKSQIDLKEYKGKEVVYITKDFEGNLTVELN